MIYGWTPDQVLNMRASLFFHMLAKGRLLEKRRKFRDYMELTRVAVYPTLTEKSKEDVLQYFWDGSVSEWEKHETYRITKEMESKASSAYAAPSDVLSIFRGAN